MPLASTVVIADATPTNHTFSPVQVSTQKALLLDKSTSIPASNKTMVLKFNLANANRATDRIRQELHAPIEQTIDFIVSVRSTPRFLADWVMPADMDDAERENFVAMVVSFIGHAITEAYARSRDPMYG
jgi:hypothetical protein